jgi:hypothetical protein
MARTFASIFALFRARPDSVLDARFDALRAMPDLRTNRRLASPFDVMPRTV